MGAAALPVADDALGSTASVARGACGVAQIIPRHQSCDTGRKHWTCSRPSCDELEKPTIGIGWAVTILTRLHAGRCRKADDPASCAILSYNGSSRKHRYLEDVRAKMSEASIFFR